MVAHLYDPVALLVNQKVTASHYARLFLKGCSATRDAIGTIVRAEIAGQPRVIQLTAGDGFNGRCVTIGLGTVEAAQAISVE